MIDKETYDRYNEILDLLGNVLYKIESTDPDCNNPEPVLYRMYEKIELAMLEAGSKMIEYEEAQTIENEVNRAMAL